jgi:AAA domain
VTNRATNLQRIVQRTAQRIVQRIIQPGSAPRRITMVRLKKQSAPEKSERTLAFFDRDIKELEAARPSTGDWLWHGYLAPRQTTLLTAMWKTGKTTFIAGLLAKLKAGGEYCGHKVRPGRALVVSEEENVHWLNRARKLDLEPHVRFICKPFAGRPTSDEWEALLDHIVAMHELQVLDLVVIDTLTSFTPYCGENHASNVIDFLTSLRRLTEQGISVLLKHHPRKSESAIGSYARGTGALSASIDIVLEMYRIGQFGDGDRRRLLFGLSRHDETPIRMAVELDLERGEYVRSADQMEDEFAGGWPVLRVVLEDAVHKLTRIAILKGWPDDFPRPHPSNLWRWLDRAVNDGLVLRDGLGRKRQPFRYWLPGAEERWMDRGFYFEDIPDLDPPPDDAHETARKLAEAGRVLFEQSKRKKVGKK